MTPDEEREFLSQQLARAENGDILTAKHLHPALCQHLGQEVSLDYVYKLLHRHEWRKLAPRPHHVKQNPAAAAAFKKNSRKRSKP
jgi:transposase